MERVNLTQLEVGKVGIVVEIQGGHRLAKRIQALGIREGKRIRKVSSQVLRGPITIEIDNSQVAIGFGMARRIIIENGKR